MKEYGVFSYHHYIVVSQRVGNTLVVRRGLALLAKFSDSIYLKDGLLNNRVCTVKFLVVNSYFLCITTHTV